MQNGDDLLIGGERIEPGERRDLDIKVSQSYSGTPVYLPVTVWRGEQAGPTVFVTAVVHGDELNGAGIVRELILRPRFALVRGSLILVPVVNVLGFERLIRYLPDRRDLNRSFPGQADGSLARRFAYTVFSEIVANSDFGIDFHTAAVRRTNFPNVRGDLSNPGVERLAWAFGSELVVNGKGPVGSLRRSACQNGCPTIILEAGEVWKIEPTVVECGVRGVTNVLIELGMVEGKRKNPAYQVQIEKTAWVRADCGGMLQFHVAPGSVVEKEQPIATNTNLLGKGQNVLRSPSDGVILGMTTMPMVKPGDPVVHLATPIGGIEPIRAALEGASNGSLHDRLRDDLATNITVSAPRRHRKKSGSPKS
jgi:uncharacterized protein